MKNVVLLTGANGFLGTQIARILASNPENRIAALVRAEDQEAASLRLSRAWWDWPELVSLVGGRVEVLSGDVSLPRLGLDDGKHDDLARSVTHVIHSAADLRLYGPLNEVRKTNVQGTANVVDLARLAHRDHGLERLSHISTAYVAGDREGTISEDSLEEDHAFYNVYELTKHEGERLVRAAGDLPVSIFRPGMIVGDSRTGAVKTFNTVYALLRQYFKGQLRFIPARYSLRLNVVPVDYVSQAIVDLTFDPGASGLTFHLTAPWKRQPSAGELHEFMHDWAEKSLGLKLPTVHFFPLPLPSAQIRMGAEVTPPSRDERSDPLKTLAPYFNEHRSFQRDNTDRLLGTYDFRWREVMPRLLEYAVYRGFLHRADRTVHEQILFRLQSESMPVTYHDIIEKKIITRDTGQVRSEMLTAAKALRSMGIGKGDRVALVGLNSTRYLTLDVAIGLVGAASVPLYYTSPPAEIREILSASQAKLLFVGAPRVLERLGELNVDIPIVSFCRRNPEIGGERKVMGWEDFLASGGVSEAPMAAPVGFGDLATVRYTSGTTGSAKGVCFDHENLRWMGEAVCSLFPWKVRSTRVVYLSFLPMNHVVEGIIGTYSPYYAPAQLDVYFLEEFRDLQHILPRVRPTVFFSVPRFYEKAWEGLKESWIGRRYIKAGEGITRSLLRHVLRRAFLKRVGLDRCAQLIAGSAHMSEALLRNFRELGIGVHNAYGLTEAPLVTMNRIGKNRIETVGEPLPKTEIRAAEDGEILVRGPQVTRGYLDKGADQPFRDGWLITGDLGHVDDDGCLVLRGRKKELIKTSYGKFVHPAKIELMLKEIVGVEEAMLVGEGRPYCSAILWVARTGDEAGLVSLLEKGIAEVNSRLSHPEQVKRWAILEDDLAIERGDLTANLKLKRGNVASRLKDVVEAMYGGPPSRSSGIIHIGGGEKV